MLNLDKDLKVLRKIYETADQYKWIELETYEDNFKAIDFPEDAERFINAFTTKPNEKFAVVVGSYKTRFYTEEEKFTWITREYAAVVTLTLEKPFNNFFITDKNYDFLGKNNIFKPFQENSFLNVKKTNLIKDLYKKVSQKVSGVENIYDEFLIDLDEEI